MPENYPFDADRAKKLERYYNLAKESGDQERVLKALNEMKSMMNSVGGQASPQPSELDERLKAELSAAAPATIMEGRAEALGAEAPSRPQVTEDSGEFRVAKLRALAPEGTMFARDLEEIGDAPELSEMNFDSFKRALATNLIGNEDELANAIKSLTPGAEVEKDPEGKSVIKFPSGKSYAVNKPGLSPQDLNQAVTRILSYTPAGKIVGGTLQQVGKSALAAGVTEGALQGLETAVGGEFNPADVGISAAGGAIASKIFSYGRPTAKQQSILRELRENPRNPDFAKFLVVNGKPEASKALQTAARNLGGDGDAIVAVAKNASNKDKQAMRNMVSIIRKSKKDPLYKDANRIGDVVGETLKTRVRDIKSLNTSAGKKIDEVARQQLKGKQVDISQPLNEFKQVLADKLRVNIDEGVVDFTNSALTGGNSSAARGLVKELARRLRKTDIDASDAHFIKRFIDNQVTFGKAQGGLSGDLDGAVKALRAGINNNIRGVSKPYATANQKYSDTINALDNLQKSAGSTLNLDSVAALGVKLRSLTNNTAARDKLRSSIEEIEDVARKYGIRYKDDILTQNNIANALEKRFGTQGSTTLKSEIGKGIADEVTKSNIQRASDLGAGVINKLFQVSDDDALNSFLRIL